jgi:hypothetical protein
MNWKPIPRPKNEEFFGLLGTAGAVTKRLGRLKQAVDRFS